MTQTFTDNHLLMTIEGNAIWKVQTSHSPHWMTKLFGVRVHSHSEGAAINFSVVDLNMEFVLPSTDRCV